MPDTHPASLDIAIKVDTDPDGSAPEVRTLLHHRDGILRFLHEGVERYIKHANDPSVDQATYSVTMTWAGGGGRLDYRAADYPAELAPEPEGDES